MSSSSEWKYDRRAYLELHNGVWFKEVRRTDNVDRSDDRINSLFSNYPSFDSITRLAANDSRTDSEISQDFRELIPDDLIFAMRIRLHRRIPQISKSSELLSKLLALGTKTWESPNTIPDPMMRSFGYSAILANELLRRLEQEEAKVRNPVRN